MASPDFTRSRLPPILNSLIVRTEAEAIEWEAAAVPDGYAVTVGEVRFRIRSMDGDGQQPYALEFLIPGPSIPAPVIVTGHDEILDEMVSQLYFVARRSAVGDPSDPFDSVEQALGLTPASDDPNTA
jgi:hypothetical protein